jgi:hypothetical protein
MREAAIRPAVAGCTYGDFSRGKRRHEIVLIELRTSCLAALRRVIARRRRLLAKHDVGEQRIIHIQGRGNDESPLADRAIFQAFCHDSPVDQICH